MLLSCPNTYFGLAPTTPSEMLLYAKHGVPLTLSLVPASLLCPTGQLPAYGMVCWISGGLVPLPPFFFFSEFFLFVYLHDF